MSAEWLVMHGHALLCAVDASSAPDTPADMRAIDADLDFRFSSLLPAGTRTATRGARARFDFGLPPERIAGSARPTPVQLAAPRNPTLRVRGSVRDPAGRWQPRQFDLRLAAGAIVPLPLYPTPLGTPASSGGRLFGSLRLPNGAAAAWARLELRVTVAPGRSVSAVAQADGNGDFVLAAARVPLPPANVASFPAELRGFHRGGNWPDGLNPDTQQPWTLLSAGAGTFAEVYAFDFPPGAALRPLGFQRQTLVIRAPQA